MSTSPETPERSSKDWESPHTKTLCDTGDGDTTLEQMDGDETLLTRSLDGGAEVDIVGAHVGPYRVSRRLGAGGMGAVFLADRDDGELSMSVCIKLIKREIAGATSLAHFKRERQILADLKHPHIAMLLDGGSWRDHPYFIMEFIEGETIEKWCAHHMPGLADLLIMFRKIVEAVGFAHGKGVIHRDIKPGNIMVSSEGEPKLLDFGIARLVDPGLAGGNFVAMTPEYASPEQRAGQVVGQAADVYSLGLVLLQLITGQSPNNLGKSPSDVIEDLSQPAHTKTTLADSDAAETTTEIQLNDLQGIVPETLCHVLRLTLAEDSALRYADTALLLADLDRVIARLPKSSVQNEARYDVMLWYHDDDLECSEQLSQLLQQAGLQVWREPEMSFDDEALNASRLAALVETRSCLVCLGPSDSPPWSDDIAFRDSLSFQADRVRLVPLLLPGARFPEKQSLLPTFLRDLAWTSLTELSRSKLDPLVAALARRQDLEVSLAGICPFRGLEVFREEDRHVFFGRESVTQRIVIHLEQNPFLAVLGPSGSGKSSVVQAGVIPRFREHDFEILLFAPSQKPLEEIAFALAAAFERAGATHAAQDLLTQLRASNQALFELLLDLNEAGSHAGLLLVVDQFEEVFTLALKQEEAAGLIDNLCYLFDQNHADLACLLTMRSDFLGKCAAHADLNKFITENLIQVEAMNRDELARAIEIPARMAGLQLEEGLLLHILDEVSGGAAELPLLEHALLELYQRREEHRLTNAAFAAIGGIEGALAQRAEHEFAVLDEDARHTLRKMFTLCLIHPGEGAHDTRRRATRDELLAVGNPAVVNRILADWTRLRLLSGSGDTGRGREMVDVAHEALIRGWHRIGDWMAEDRETVRLINRLRQYAGTWRDSNKDPDHLLRGTALMQMAELMNMEGDRLGVLETEFLEAANVLARREERGKQRVRTIMLALGVLGVVLAVFAFGMMFRAAEAQQAALAEKARAESETREGNYNLSLAFNKEAGSALDQGNVREAWLFSLAALHQDIPAVRRLPEPRGRFVDPRMEGVQRLLWTSPIAAQTDCVAVHGDKLLALAGEDNMVRIIDAATGRQTAFLNQAGQDITALAFSADGAWLAAGSERRNIYLWKMDEQRFFQLGEGHFGAILDVAFSADGHWLASSDEYGGLMIHDLRHGFASTQLKDLGVTSRLLFVDDHLWLGLSAGGLKRLSPNRPERAQTLIESGTAPTAGLSHFGGLVAHADVNGALAVFGLSGRQAGVRQLPHQVTGLAGEPGDPTLVITTPDTTLYTAEPLAQALSATAIEPPLHDVVYAAGIITGRDEMGRLQRYRPDSGRVDNLIGHGHVTWDAAWSHDGRYLASSSWDHQIILWDQSPAQNHRILRGHEERVQGLAFLPSNDQLISAYADGTLKLWDLESDRPSETLRTAGGQMHGICISPDGTHLAAAFRSGKVEVWDIPKRRLLHRLNGHEDVVYKVAFSPDGELLASASYDHTVRLWDMTRPGESSVLTGHDNRVYSVAFSNDGSVLASGSWDKSIRLWDMSGKTPTRVLTGHEGAIYGLSFSPDGRKLASASFDQTLRLWDLESGAASVMDGHVGAVYDAAYSPNGDMLASVGRDQTVRLWSARELDTAKVLRDHTDRVLSASFSPDGALLASASFDQTVRLWDAQTGGAKGVYTGHDNLVSAVAFDPRGGRLASSSFDRSVRLWDLAGTEPAEILTTEGSLASLAYSGDGAMLAAGSLDKSVYLWNLDQGGQARQLRGHAEAVYGIAFHPEKRMLASASHDFSVRIWDLEEMRESRVFNEHGAGVYSVCFSPDGRILASGSGDKTVRLWNATSGRTLHVLRGHTDRVFGVLFTPDGRRVVSLSADRTVRLWDVEDGSPYAVLSGHKEALGWYPGISPDGNLLATPSDDRTVRLWRLDRFLAPPANRPAREWYDEVLERSLYQMGYDLDGFQLYPRPHIRLQGAGRELKPSLYQHLDAPRPADQDYIHWLMQD